MNILKSLSFKQRGLYNYQSVQNIYFDDKKIGLHRRKPERHGRGNPRGGGETAKARAVKAGMMPELLGAGAVGVIGRAGDCHLEKIKVGNKEFPEKGNIILVKFPKWDKIKNVAHY